MAASLWACGLVDEDMRDCDNDCTISYAVSVVTNMTTQLRTELSLETDIAVSSALETVLQDVFTDYAHDVDLSFYDIQADSARLHHEAHIMDARESSYTLYIPVRKYMHLAVANVAENPGISLEGGDRCHGASLHQAVGDTLEPHVQGVFTARLPMDVKEGVDQAFEVDLYMANCAEALVLDTLGCRLKDIRVYAAGFATDFDMADSTYHHAYTPLLRTRRLVPDSGSELCFVCVNFPSREAPFSKADDDEPPLWQFRVYATTQDGLVTETLLGVRQPVGPGQLRVIKAQVYPDGSFEPGDPTVAVNVTLDWKPGLEHEVVL